MEDSRIHKATRRLPGDNAKWSLLIARLSSRVVPFSTLRTRQVGELRESSAKSPLYDQYASRSIIIQDIKIAVCITINCQKKLKRLSFAYIFCNTKD